MYSNSPAKFTSISQSDIWEIKDHFATSGTEMFEKKIPFWITSNPKFAMHIATIIIKSIKDILKKKPTLIKEHIYILEGGSGLGKFGFYCISILQTLLKKHSLNTLNITYILTDISKPLCNFWKQNESLTNLMKQGKVDYAQIDVSSSISTINLHYSKKTLHLNTLKFPLLYIGNYIWDSVPFDAYKIRNNQLYEKKMKTTKKNNHRKFNFKNLSIEYKDEHCHKAPYKHSLYNKLIAHYIQEFSNIEFIFPVSTLTFLESLKKNCKAGYIIISSDKGNSKNHHFNNNQPPNFIGHDSYFSCSANFHCIEKYFIFNKGNSIIPNNPNTNFDTFVFSLNVPELKSTKKYILNYENEANSSTILLLRKMIRKTKSLSMKEILNSLYVSHFDPEMFSILSTYIFNEFKLIQQTEKERLIYALDNVYEFLFIQKNEHTQTILINLSVCFLRLNQPKKSILILQKAIKIYKPDDYIYKNLSIAYNYLNKTKLSLKYKLLSDKLISKI